MRLLLVLSLLLSPYSYAEEFRMLTWNVFMLPKPIKFSNQNQRRKAQVEELSKIQNDLDFVVLNEAFTKSSRNAISEELKSSLPNTARLKRKGGLLKVMDSGVMVMSRYPMKVLGEEYYKKCSKADCFASKGVILVEVTLPSGKQIQVAATHMQSGGKQKQIDVRKTQLEQIKQLFAKYARPGVPQILAGDLNIDSQKEQEFNEALDHLDMTTVAPSGDITTSKSMVTSCFGQKSSPQKAWKDHILLQNQGSSTSIVSKSAYPMRGFVEGSECDLSDHLPVKAVINVDNKSEVTDECLPPYLPAPVNFEDLLKIPLIKY